jgi:hypothetical protein
VENRPPAPSDRPLLVVAGTFPLGIGLLFRLPRPNDGWIQVSETRVEGARTILSGAWHFGLLFSRKVAEGVCAFFQGETGNRGGDRFDRQYGEIYTEPTAGMRRTER